MTKPKWISALWLVASAAFAANPMDDAVASLQHEWAAVQYQTPDGEKLQRWEQLASKAHQVSVLYPGRSEPLVWEGIIVSSWAGDKGGLGALGLAKQAKALYEQAMAIDPLALQGSAYGSLGVLYFKVPGWPIGFGSNAKAEDLLKKALEINPQGVDPNYFYGEYLMETHREQAALGYLEKAVHAPPRPGRSVADAGRHVEAQALLTRLKANGH